MKIVWPEDSPMAEPDPEYYAIWESLLIRALADNPVLSEKTAQLLLYLIDRIENNPEVGAKLLHRAFNIAFHSYLPDGERCKSEDPNLFAKSVLDQIIAKHDPESVAEEEEIKKSGKNSAAVVLGRLGGKKGGKARTEKLSARQPKEIAQKAAAVRWSRKL